MGVVSTHTPAKAAWNPPQPWSTFTEQGKPGQDLQPLKLCDFSALRKLSLVPDNLLHHSMALPTPVRTVTAAQPAASFVTTGTEAAVMQSKTPSDTRTVTTHWEQFCEANPHLSWFSVQLRAAVWLCKCKWCSLQAVPATYPLRKMYLPESKQSVWR